MTPDEAVRELEQAAARRARGVYITADTELVLTALPAIVKLLRGLEDRRQAGLAEQSLNHTARREGRLSHAEATDRVWAGWRELTEAVAHK